MLGSFSLLSHIAFRGPSIPLLVDMTIHILGFVCTPVLGLLGLYLRVELLGLIVILCLTT